MDHASRITKVFAELKFLESVFFILREIILAIVKTGALVLYGLRFFCDFQKVAFQHFLLLNSIFIQR